MRMKRATTGSGSSLNTGVSLSTFPWKVWRETGLCVVPCSPKGPTLAQTTRAKQKIQAPTISS